MNTTQLKKLGVPDICIPQAIQGIQSIAKTGEMRGSQLKDFIRGVIATPAEHVHHPHFGQLARELIAEQEFTPTEPAPYQTWGSDIDVAAHVQMRQSCAVPVSRRGALMPDAHVGYGLPIGGVLACENAVIPYAVGVDIACRMKLSVFDLPPSALEKQFETFQEALEKGTRFGVGGQHERPQQHPVMDLDWEVSRVTRENKDKAWKQLGTSGSGNHFAEFGVLTLDEPAADLGLAAGSYVALLSHSGSRGAGAAVCSTYSAIAQGRLSKRYTEFGRLAWLGLETEAGQEYWAAMNLMGEYAAANHDVIHRLVGKLIGSQKIAGVENHHNFAWKEIHDGREMIVHRKGATPAGLGVLGVIPGSMADPGYVVRGRGNEASLRSASHGAGRAMSRTKAKDTYTWKAVQNDLKKRGITVLSAGADEVPYAYKRIDEVMAQQQDLVEIVARFDPKIVKMCGDGSAAED
jgi:tRNA-splicing ligase RtcB